MENENTANNKMENIFYAALALHVARKEINKDNIRLVLRAAGTPVDEAGLDIIAAFMESLKASHLKNGSLNDPRLIKILTSALMQQKMQVEQLETLLAELSAPTSRNAKTGQSQLTACASPDQPGITAVADSGVEAKPSEGLLTGQKHGGRYVYGIANAAKEVDLGPIGIDGCRVYTIVHQDLAAIVHDCPLEAYQSSDDEKVKGWVKEHQNVLDSAKECFEIIIPLGFDTIIKPGEGAMASDQVVKDWLRNDYTRFQSVIKRIEGKDEYAVQISYIPSEIRRHLPEPSQEVIKIKTEMAKKSPGIAYIYKQKLEKTLKADMEKLSDEWFKDFYKRISNHVDDIIVEKNRNLENDRVMLLSLSCLVAKDKVAGLGGELENIDKLEGFSVHFSGPWPPYSFVAKPITASGDSGN